MTLVDKVRAAGVVGAGGGGFPTHVKLAAEADVVIANGAECEPLLHKDAAILEREAALVVQGVLQVMLAVHAGTGVVAIKAKNEHAVEKVTVACRGTPVRVHTLGDFYPAGDEFDLVYGVTGRLIPAGGIPLKVGAIVSNVETLANISRAAQGQPVTHKTLTIAGDVRSPVTLTVPIGTSLADCIDAAGGTSAANPVVCIGGVMMGEPTSDLARPVTKTTAGLVVLSREHPVMRRKLLSPEQQNQIGKSACDQCRYCTELCPRYLLGYAVEPHQVMRSLAFNATGTAHWNAFAGPCCGCGLCTLYACPEQLFPKEACDRSKTELRRAGVTRNGVAPAKPHRLRSGRRVPGRLLLEKLALAPFDHAARWNARVLSPRELVLPLRQGAGVAGTPIVKRGEAVLAGQPLTSVAPTAVGSVIHAPLSGTIAAIGEHSIVLNPPS
jgi:Na+-translocating ferredoxin:NAD+ oxidoreductase RnfC subunit